MADGVGFEPTDSRPSLVFKTSAFNRSATHPKKRMTADKYRQQRPAILPKPRGLSILKQTLGFGKGPLLG